jgi:hypothetical protein
MLNFFKRTIVRFLTRKYLLVSNKTTQEVFIVSHISLDGYIVLLTQYDTYLPVQYKVLKDNFTRINVLETVVGASNVLSIQDNLINLSSGESVKLSDINEPMEMLDGID